LLTAERAREDIVEFFDFVMEDQERHLPIRAVAHQRVHLRFVMDHRRSVSLIAAEHAKTFDAVAITLYMLGGHPNLRGVFLSAAQEQSKKAVRMVSDYVLANPRLRLVFPELLPSDRRDEPWTQTAITVRRPPGTADPSLVALGIDGPIWGRRIDWLVGDDLLTAENTATSDGRRKVHEWVDGSALSRMMAGPEARVAMSNTAWHPDDFIHRLVKAGWATCRMSITGDIEIRDDADPFNRRTGGEMWDSDELVPAKCYPYLRLAEHEPDPEEKTPLFPERFPVERVERLRRERLPQTFQQMYEQVAHDDASAMCKREWIEECKRKAREAGVHHLLERWPEGQGVVFMGIDLAIGKGEHHDDTAFFTFAVLPSGTRQILDVDYGRYDGASNIARLKHKIEAYSVNLARVENNAAQDFFRQWALDKQVNLPLEAHTTTARKSHPEDGIQGLFLEIFNGAWLIPNDRNGVCDPRVQRFCDACVNFVPDEHTDDVLMAAWIGQQGARRWGLGTEPRKDSEGGGGVGELLMR
jgi:hypothetical protein